MTSPKELVIAADTGAMALHDRLKPATLETAPPRAASALPLTIALAVLAAAFAFAMPRLETMSAEGEPETSVVTAPEVVTDEEPDAEKEAAEPNEDPKEESTEDEGAGKPDNHGSAVSTAAHCDVKGKDHGALVRSIAQDKEATVADAEAACTAALAAAAADEAAADKKVREPKATKPVKEPQAVRAPKPAKPTVSHKPVTAPAAKPDKPSKP